MTKNGVPHGKIRILRLSIGLKLGFEQTKLYKGIQLNPPGCYGPISIYLYYHCTLFFPIDILLHIHLRR